jgi:hypothetical protein
LGGSVMPDEKITVGKTELDLGSLAQGTGFTPLAPWLPASPYSPWGGAYAQLFKTYQVYNEGNVNLLNVRVAKATDQGGPLRSWGLSAPENAPGTWIDTMFNLWSDIDRKFALNNLGGSNSVLVQKARVGDRNAPELLTDPIRRTNAQIGVVQSALLANPASASPRISVTIPIGTPIGTYLTDIRIIEDDTDNESLTFAGANAVETFSDPTIRLRFNVREARVTNGLSAFTAPMAHGALSGGETFLHRNAQPAAMRDLNGQLVLAFASNSPDWNDPQPLQASTNDQWRIFVGSLNGNVPSSVTFGQNPMRDLMDWVPDSARWYRQALGPLPTQTVTDPAIFGPGAIVGTAKFGGPAFSQLGGFNPYFATPSNPLMVYLGEVQIQTPTGRTSASKIFLSELTVGGDGSISESGVPASISDNPELVKSRPVLLQAGNTGTVIYTGTVGGQSRFYHAYYNGTSFLNSQPLNVGAGFENVGAASVVGRRYLGAPIPGTGVGPQSPIADFLFTGKLKGRTNRELFMGRLRTTINGQLSNIQGTRTPVIPWAQLMDESIAPESELGTYRARGVAWPIDAAIQLVQLYNGTRSVLIDPNTRVLDAETGLITYDCRLGGKVYLDTTQGTVRFSGSAPNRRATILLTYTPRFIRVGAVNSANYQMPSINFDNRFTDTHAYVFQQNGNAATGACPHETARYVLSFGRSANGTGETSRPYMRSLRFGIQLLHPVTGEPVALHTQPNGALTNLAVTGYGDGMFVDPANGRIYFGSDSEGRTITVNSFASIDEATGAAVVHNGPFSYSVRLTTESGETPIPIEGAINESQMVSFIDLFDNPGIVSERRGTYLWMFWMSMRGGAPDIYMQTVAPNYSPRPRSQGGP